MINFVIKHYCSYTNLALHSSYVQTLNISLMRDLLKLIPNTRLPSYFVELFFLKYNIFCYVVVAYDHFSPLLIHLGSTLLCITSSNQLIKKWIDFVETKFHLNENIECHCMQLEMELDLIQNFKFNKNTLN